MSDPEDVIKDMYLNLMKQGWSLYEIDNMDIYFFFELLNHQSKPKLGFIDQVI